MADAIPVLIDSIGQLGTASSTRRVKDEIRDMEDASEGLLRLRPVTFRYTQHTASGSQRLQYGLVAEEVAEVIPELVVRDADGGPETVIYHQLPAMLLNELQKQHARIETLTSRMRALEQQLAEVLPKTGEARVE